MSVLQSYLQSVLSTKNAADAQVSFGIYRDFLIEQNKLFNLTAIIEPDEIDVKHFIDSLAALPYIQGEVADIGTGAGFPGLPLAIVCPSAQFTLIDSLQKRISFLDALKEKLQIRNVSTLHARAEDLPKNKKYDVIVSRAVSRLNTLCEYCLPFVKTGGLFIAYKSADCDEEVNEAKNAISVLGGQTEEMKTVCLFGTDIERKLILIRKINETLSKYPRGQNKPKKQPLL